MKQMYRGQTNSPETILTKPIGGADTVIYVENVDVFPDAPNIAVLGEDETAETILYTAKIDGTLSGCTRAWEGTAIAWESGTVISRRWTAGDHNTIIDNLNEMKQIQQTEYQELTTELENKADNTSVAEELNKKEDKANKGKANGYASLTADGKVPKNQLPTIKEVPAGGTTGQVLKRTATGYNWGTDNNTTYSNATSSKSGLMSNVDKGKLDKLPTLGTGEQVITIQAYTGDLNTLHTAGVYSVRNPSNRPAGANGYASVIVTKTDNTTNNSATDTSQLWIGKEEGILYTRNCTDTSNVWTEWAIVGDRETKAKAEHAVSAAEALVGEIQGVGSIAEEARAMAGRLNLAMGEFEDALQTKEDKAKKGVANGYASLDAAGKVPQTQLPKIGGMPKQGKFSWDYVLDPGKKEWEIELEKNIRKLYVINNNAYAITEGSTSGKTTIHKISNSGNIVWSKEYDSYLIYVWNTDIGLLYPDNKTIKKITEDGAVEDVCTLPVSPNAMAANSKYIVTTSMSNVQIYHNRDGFPSYDNFSGSPERFVMKDNMLAIQVSGGSSYDYKKVLSVYDIDKKTFVTKSIVGKPICFFDHFLYYWTDDGIFRISGSYEELVLPAPLANIDNNSDGTMLATYNWAYSMTRNKVMPLSTEVSSYAYTTDKYQYMAYSKSLRKYKLPEEYITYRLVEE
ncbi:MAG: pyocin knob domain-containing protein [Tissierellia bacterium]|nr:pyocin knob domain-containing protein [Tissierellia bacterium]